MKTSRPSASRSPPFCCDAHMLHGSSDWEVISGEAGKASAASQRASVDAGAARRRALAKRAEARSGGRGAVARRGAMLMLLNRSTVVADIKGQAGSSRWRFCRLVSPFSDSDFILSERKLLTRLYCRDGGKFPRG